MGFLVFLLGLKVFMPVAEYRTEKSFFISSTVLVVRSYLLVSIMHGGLVITFFEFRKLCVCSMQIRSIRDFSCCFDFLMFLWVSVLVWALNVMYLMSL